MKKNCKKIRDVLLENPDQKKLIPELKKHLETCAECRKWILDVQLLESLWELSNQDLPSAEEITIARQEAIRRIRHGEGRFSIQNWLQQRLSWKIAWGAALAVVVFAAGIYLGNMLRHLQPGTLRTAQKAVPGWIMKAVQSQSAKLPQELQINGWGVSQVLAYLVKYDQNEGHRLNSVEELANIGDDRLAQDALIYALLNDPNPGVRMKAIKSLSQRKMNTDLRDTYIYALWNDGNAGIRLEAIDALTPIAQDKQVMETLQFIAASDAHEGVRTQAREVIRAVEIG